MQKADETRFERALDVADLVLGEDADTLGAQSGCLVH